MRTIEEIRRLRLQELRQSHKLADLNEMIGLKRGDSTLSQILSANTKKNMGPAIARRLEQACEKPAGWMDSDPEQARIEWPFVRISREDVSALSAAQLKLLEAGLVAAFAAAKDESEPDQPPHPIKNTAPVKVGGGGVNHAFPLKQGPPVAPPLHQRPRSRKGADSDRQATPIDGSEKQ